MRIAGLIQVEDVTLHVDIDVPDGEQEVFVTNISSRCLVIPKERWPLEFLELGGETLAVLHSNGLRTIGDVTDIGWTVQLSATLSPLEEEVQRALDHLRNTVALSFSPEDGKNSAAPAVDEVPAKEPFPIRVDITPESSLSDIGLGAEILRILLAKRNVRTVGQLRALGKHKLMFTAGVSAGDVIAVDGALRNHGVGW